MAHVLLLCRTVPLCACALLLLLWPFSSLFFLWPLEIVCILEVTLLATGKIAERFEMETFVVTL